MGSNKDVAECWLAAFGSGDIATVRELMTADGAWQLMGTSVLAGERTVDEFTELAGQLHGAMEHGLTFDIHAITAEEDRVAIEFSGSSELVTGAAYDNDYHLLIRFRDGKICRVHEYCDSKLVDAVVSPLFAEASQEAP